MSVTFHIRVLGDFTVLCDGALAPLPQSRKTRALLAYLAVNEKPMRRERLCELLWDIPDDPRGALRWSLSKLRQILNVDGGTRLEADRNTVYLIPSSVSLDYNLIRGLSPESIDSLPIERLETIAQAFSGSFLSDLYLPRCSAYEAWRVYCINETDILHVKALRALVNRLGDEPERALVHLHALQSLLPEQDFSKEISRIRERARQIAATLPSRAIDSEEALRSSVDYSARADHERIFQPVTAANTIHARSGRHANRLCREWVRAGNYPCIALDVPSRIRLGKPGLGTLDRRILQRLQLCAL
jgi:hypothetical protein